MELRVLRYYVTVANEQSFSKAAEKLHLSQPTLSRQLKELEDELGTTLMVRSTRQIDLTEEGVILLKRAEEILSLVDRTTNDVVFSSASTAGNVYIGMEETEGFRCIAKAIRRTQEEYPNIRFHIISGDTHELKQHLEHGLVDFMYWFGTTDDPKNEYLHFPVQDRFGVLMRKDSPLASKEIIEPEDLWDKPLIISRRMFNTDLSKCLIGKEISELDIISTYTQSYSGEILVDEGLGYAIDLEGVTRTGSDSSLCFRPIRSPLVATGSIAWKQNGHLSKPAQIFLRKLRELYE